MTEQEWLVSDDPQRMLTWLKPTSRAESEGILPGTRQPSARKLRLFAVACCRAVADGTPCRRCGGDGEIPFPVRGKRIPCPTCKASGRVGGLTDPRSRRAVEVAERFADGLATEAELEAADFPVGSVDGPDEPPNPDAAAANLCGWGSNLQAMIHWVLVWLKEPVLDATQAALLRDICGNPWRGPVFCGVSSGVNTSWRDCSDYKAVLERIRTPTVVALAQAIYAERGFDRLPILADALEESGCTDADIIGHCRGPGPHVLGCWVVDLLLGKE